MPLTAFRAPASRPGRSPLVAALERPRYEVLPLEGIADDVCAHVAREIKITVTASPSKGLEPTIGTAEQLRRSGYAVVPHLSARLVRDRRHLDEIVARLREARIDEVFVIAGDARQPAGEFAGAAELLEALPGAGGRFERIGISGYPESHHLISDETTIEAMFRKEPLASYIVSQICFDPATIAGWIEAVRERGTFLPIWIGVPGAVDTRRLLKTSLRIGLGSSTRFLRANRRWLRRLASPRVHTPTRLLEALIPTFADRDARVGGIHVYTFNELERTERWRLQLVDRLSRQ